MNSKNFVNSYKDDSNGLQVSLNDIIDQRMESFRKKRDALRATTQRISGTAVNQASASGASITSHSFQNSTKISAEVVDLTLSDDESSVTSSSEYYVVRRNNRHKHNTNSRHSGERKKEKGNRSHRHHKDKSKSSSKSKRHRVFSQYRQY